MPFGIPCWLGAFAKTNNFDAVNVLENSFGDPRNLLPPAIKRFYVYIAFSYPICTRRKFHIL